MYMPELSVDISDFNNEHIDPNLTDYEADMASDENTNGLDKGYWRILAYSKVTKRRN